MNTEEKEKYYHDDSINLYYQDLSERTLFLDILKFHQKSAFFMPENNDKEYLGERINSYLKEVEYRIPLIQNYSEEIFLGKNDVNNVGSLRDFNQELSIDELGKVLKHTFAVDNETLHRKFPSGGALFPIYVVVLHLGNNETFSRGAYFYDGVKNALLKVSNLSEQINNHSIEYSLTPDGIPLSDICILYLGDLEKIFFKYKYAGYRHLFIETGMMAQELRDSLHNINSAGDLSFSGFRHNLLLNFLKIPVNQYIVTMIQWIGKKHD